MVSCSGGNCWFVPCNTNSDCGINQYTGGQSCRGNNVWQNYITYTCNGAGTSESYCTTSIIPRYQTTCSIGQTCQYGICVGEGTRGTSATAPPPSSSACSYHAYQKCIGNAVYWFDSCNNQQDLFQACSAGQTCSNNTCQPNYSASYNRYAARGCINNNLYWYDSFGNQQDLYQNCSAAGQVCRDGQCLIGQTSFAQSSSFVKNYRTSCYKDNLYWYDSNGNVQDIAKSCLDENSCTADTCSNTKCANTLKCDGSTCPADSTDYAKYCTPQNKSQVAAAAASESPSALKFIKNWYVWIIILIILIFLFIIIFRRLSSKV